MQLRNYQKLDLDKLRNAYKQGFKAPLFVGPTGYGKTVLFSHIATSMAAKGKRAIILCHRQELVDQIEKALRQCNIIPGVIAAGYPETNSLVQIASVMTLHNRLERIAKPDLLVVDEAHHCTLNNTWGKVLNHWPDVFRLGVTATPIRLSGEGLSDVFDTLICGPTTKELIDLGYLTPLRVFAPPSPDLSGVHKRMGEYVIGELEEAMSAKSVMGDAVTHYKKHANGKRAIVFCVSIKHAQAVCNAFNEAGIRSAHVDGTMLRNERTEIINSFRNGEINVLTSCDLVSEGFDLPAIEVGISLRPTQSEGLWRQQIGRCLRRSDNKTSAIILDHAGNALRHGLPTDAREWELTETKEKKKGGQEKISQIRLCKSCFAANESTAIVCKECGETFPVKERKLAQIEGDLVEIKGGGTKRKIVNNADTIEGLIALGTMRGYKNPHGWATHVFHARQIKKTRTTQL
jgi:superfamily II DNA or RNA helicase